MHNLFAFIGTGPCNENKTAIEVAVLVAVIAGWSLMAYIIRKVNHSNKSSAFRITVALSLTSGSILVTALVAFSTWLGLACSG